MAISTTYVAPKELKRLSELTPWRTGLAVALDWLVIALAIAASEITDSWLVYFPAMLVIAGRQHGLAVLLHDFAHYRFVTSKSVSDWTADLFLAWPLLATLEGYRRNHLGHHRYLNTGKDPDWAIKLGSVEFTFPQEMRFAVLNLLGYLVGISSLRDFRKVFARIRREEKFTPGYLAVRGTYYLAAIVAITLAGVWTGFLLYWALPYFTFFFMFMYIRSVSDHFGPTMNYDDDLQSTRTVMPHFGEAWFFSPHNINYHLEHHLYASVPFYRLPELQAVLMANPEYAKGAHITRGFMTGLWREIVMSKATALPALPGRSGAVPAAE